MNYESLLRTGEWTDASAWDLEVGHMQLLRLSFSPLHVQTNKVSATNRWYDGDKLTVKTVYLDRDIILEKSTKTLEEVLQSSTNDYGIAGAEERPTPKRRAFVRSRDLSPGACPRCPVVICKFS